MNPQISHPGLILLGPHHSLSPETENDEVHDINKAIILLQFSQCQMESLYTEKYELCV